MTEGRLITIEGIDGSGKTTLAAALARTLHEQDGINTHLLREPGGVVLAEKIRDLVKDPSLHTGARAEALLYAAARAQLVEQAVLPLLAAGRWVLLDRYIDSSLAYQGAARGLGVKEVLAVNSFATGGLSPDRTLLLDIDPLEARKRLAKRGEETDRLEQEDNSFFEDVAGAYRQLAEREPDRFTVLDATSTREQLLDEARAALVALMPDSD